MNKNIKIFFNYFLGPLLFAWLAWSIYKQISSQNGLEESLLKIKDSLYSSHVLYLVFTILLMMINWGLEAYKWMLAVRQIQSISFIRAFKAIFSGISFSISTPNRVGEYLGRVLYLSEGNRIKTVSLTIVSSMSQLIITIFMGLLALIFMRNKLVQSDMLPHTLSNALVYGSIVVLIILILFYFRLSWLIKIIDKLPQISRFSWAIDVIEHLNATLLVRFLSLSVTRFAVFSLQYYLLFRLFGVDINIAQCWMGISVMFLVMAAIPTIALFTDLGLKNELSIKLIGLFSPNHLGITLASLSIWLINLVFPALIGSLLILGIKNIFNKKR
ncbi:MAG: lysylphosphatidylglycerol synthase transmembrane domain-containing protein [Niabella sp.]